MDIWVEIILVVVTALQSQGGEPNTPKTFIIFIPNSYQVRTTYDVQTTAPTS